MIGYGWGEVVIYFVTIATIVFADLLSGVIVGISLSALKLLYTFSHLEAELTSDAESKSARLRLRGAATFVRLPQLAAELERVPKSFDLHVDLSELDYIDHACLELLMSWGAGHQARAVLWCRLGVATRSLSPRTTQRRDWHSCLVCCGDAAWGAIPLSKVHQNRIYLQSGQSFAAAASNRACERSGRCRYNHVRAA